MPRQLRTLERWAFAVVVCIALLCIAIIAYRKSPTVRRIVASERFIEAVDGYYSTAVQTDVAVLRAWRN